MVAVSRDRPGAASAWMGGAILSFSAMAVAGRAVSDQLDTFEIMLYRSAIGMVLVIAGAAALGRMVEIRTQRLGSHVARNLCHFAGQNLWFYGITLIPLAQLFALEFTSPIWVMLLAPLVLGERPSGRRLGLAALGFLGILIVTRPGLVTVGPGVAAGLGAAIAFAATMLLTKSLTRTATVTCILFWLTVTQLVFGLVSAGVDGAIARPTMATIAPLAVIGVAGLSAHLCVATALSLAPATHVAPIDFLRLPAIAVVGMILYDERPDIWVFVGAALIFLANWLNLRADRAIAKQP